MAARLHSGNTTLGDYSSSTQQHQPTPSTPSERSITCVVQSNVALAAAPQQHHIDLTQFALGAPDLQAHVQDQPRPDVAFATTIITDTIYNLACLKTSCQMPATNTPASPQHHTRASCPRLFRYSQPPLPDAPDHCQSDEFVEIESMHYDHRTSTVYASSPKSPLSLEIETQALKDCSRHVRVTATIIHKALDAAYAKFQQVRKGRWTAELVLGRSMVLGCESKLGKRSRGCER